MRYKKYSCNWVRARENPMKPFVRTSFLGTRPSCLPSPGRPFFYTEFITGPHRQPSKNQAGFFVFDKFTLQVSLGDKSGCV